MMPPVPLYFLVGIPQFSIRWQSPDLRDNLRSDLAGVTMIENLGG
jgi:hypothetical protein